MFDLESAIVQWRRELLASGLAPEVLPELEEHLREEVDRQLLTGAAAPAAFAVALQRLGPSQALSDEFARVGRLGLRATLRRHRARVFLCAAVGLLWAAKLNFARPAMYESEMRLSVRPAASSSAVGGEPDLAYDIEKLRSFDFSKTIVRSIGPEKVLARAGGGKDPLQAAAVLNRGLRVEAAGHNLIWVAFRHPDARVPPVVLRDVLQAYAEQLRGTRGTLTFSMVSGQVVDRVLAEIQLLQPPSPPQRVGTSAVSWGLFGTMLGVGVAVGLLWVLGIRLTEVCARSPLRHTGKVLLCAGAGFAAGFAIDALRPAFYRSSATLLLRYVVGDSAGMRRTQEANSALMARQLALLQAPDVARQVAGRVGPAIILRRMGGGDDLTAAAAVIREGLDFRVPPRNSVINITFRHPDFAVVRPVLDAVIGQYYRIYHEQRAAAVGLPLVPQVSDVEMIQGPEFPFVSAGNSSRLLTATLAAGILAGFAWIFLRREIRPRLAS